MKIFITVVLLLAHISFFGQNQERIDSLKQVLTLAKQDSVKIKTLTWLFDEYSYRKLDSAKMAYENMLSIAREKKYDDGFYQGYLYKSTYYWYKSEYDSVVSTMNKALSYAFKMEDDTKISYCYNRLAMVQSNLGNYDAAKALTLKALQIAKKNDDWKGLYYSYYRLGNTFYYENDFDQALVNYLKVDSIFELHERKEPALAASLSNIGSIYMEFKNFDQAIKYFQESKKVYHGMNRKEGEVYIDFNMGKVKFNQKKYKEAIQTFLSTLSYYSSVKNLSYMADISGWLASSYLQSKDVNNSEKYYKKSATLALRAKNKLLEANAYIGLGEIAQINNNPNLTIEYLQKGLRLYEDMNISYNKAQILKNLASAHASKNDFKAAFSFSKKYQALVDSISNKENAENFQKLELKYQTEKKEQEILLLSSQNELVKQQKKNQRNLLLGGLSLALLGGLFFFFMYRNRQRTNVKLQEIDKLKSNFFANISHEFRTPLTLISGPLDKRLSGNKLKKEERGDLEMIRDNSNKLLGLVDQLLDLSKLESGHLKLNVKSGNLSLLLKSLTQSFQYLAKKNNIEYIIEIQDSQNVWFDKSVIEKCVMNVLSNAFKYTPQNGSVIFKSLTRKNQIELFIENTGTELSGEAISRIFNRFYQVHENSSGVGIGLSLVKELVDLSHGSINVENTSDNTILFRIILPIDKTKFSKDELSTDSELVPELHWEQHEDALAFATKTETNNDFDDSIPLLLIVEDNLDIRHFIAQSFSEKYRVLEAENGTEGINKALEFVPDIIVSDILMPETDGLELCKKLKTDERTSHIPIILLTAKVGEEDQYKGLEIGADDYITKPFKIKLLRTRLKNLIKSRKLLRKRYSQEVILKPKDIAITTFDEQFLKKIETVLDEELTSPSFTVSQFSRALGMSRMQLHRKLRALTGLTTSEFIRSQRLKLAVSLLQNSDANISEIGYAVGFNDHAYFSKCFKDAYGCSPSEYAVK